MNPRLTQEWADENLTQNLVAVAPDGSGFVTAFSTRIRQYTANGTILWDKRFPVGDARALAWSRDGTTIVLAMNENILVLDRSGTQLWMANATEIVNGVAVSQDGNTIAAAGLDRNLHVFNHAGSRLGSFTVKNAIRPNSVGVTGDGQFIVLVAPDAVYGFPRSAFTGSATPVATLAETTTEVTGETPATAPPVATTLRKTTVRTSAIPTPYPRETPTPESPLSPATPLAAILLILFACHRGRR
jgi:outer membrane protein assembly factor BamB